MNGTKFPNLFLPGAMKAATSSMWSSLSSHPEICGGRIKEPHGFRQALEASEAEALYTALYRECGTVRYRLDGSQSLLSDGEALSRVRAWCGEDAKFVIALREPVARALSAYGFIRHLRAADPRRIDDLATLVDGAGSLQILLERERDEIAKLAEAHRLKTLPGTSEDFRYPFAYFAQSAYAPMLQRLFEEFGRDRCLVVRFEDYTGSNYRLLIDRIAGFLAIDAHLFPAQPIHERATRRYRRDSMRRLIDRARPLSRRLPERVRALGRVGLDRAIRVPVQERLPEPIAAQARALFVPDIVATEAITGLDLSSWRRGPSA